MKKPGTTEIETGYRFVSYPDGTKTIEIELHGVRKSDMNVLVDSDNRILIVSWKRFNTLKWAHWTKTTEKSQDKEVGNLDKKTEENENKEKAEEKKPSVVYKWRDRVDDRVELSSVEAKYCGGGILRVSLKERKETGPNRVAINRIY